MNVRQLWFRVQAKPAPWIAAGAAVVIAAGAATWMATSDSGEEFLDDLREQVGAAPTLEELRQRVKADPRSAPAHAALGDGQFAAGHRAAGLKSYAKALSIDAAVASDELLKNLVSCYGLNEQARAHALLVQHKLTRAERYLDDLAKHPKWSVRTGAISTLEALGKVTRDDYVTLWITDLGSTECKVRQYAVQKLGELGDRRALDAIRQAKKTEDATTAWFQPKCLGGRIDDAEKKILASR